MHISLPLNPFGISCPLRRWVSSLIKREVLNIYTILWKIEVWAILSMLACRGIKFIWFFILVLYIMFSQIISDYQFLEAPDWLLVKSTKFSIAYIVIILGLCAKIKSRLVRFIVIDCELNNTILLVSIREHRAYYTLNFPFEGIVIGV